MLVYNVLVLVQKTKKTKASHLKFDLINFHKLKHDGKKIK